MARSPFRFRINMDQGFNAVGALEEKALRLFKQAQREAGQEAAEAIKVKMEEFFLEGRDAWPSNHPITIAFKGFDMPLMETGLTASSVTIFSVERGNRIDYLVGFPPGPAADRALAAEFGRSVEVTETMRRFMAAQGFPLKADTKVLYIPHRQIFQPAFDDSRPKIQQAADEAIERAFKQSNLRSEGSDSKFAWLRNQLRNDRLR